MAPHFRAGQLTVRPSEDAQHVTIQGGSDDGQRVLEFHTHNGMAISTFIDVSRQSSK